MKKKYIQPSADILNTKAICVEWESDLPGNSKGSTTRNGAKEHNFDEDDDHYYIYQEPQHTTKIEENWNALAEGWN